MKKFLMAACSFRVWDILLDAWVTGVGRLVSGDKIVDWEILRVGHFEFCRRVSHMGGTSVVMHCYCSRMSMPGKCVTLQDDSR